MPKRNTPKQLPKLKRVDVPEWGVYALVRPIGPKERDALEAWIVSSMEGEKFTFRNFRGLVASLVISDENGIRIFTDKDAEWLGANSVFVLDRIVAAAFELSGIAPETPNLGEPKNKVERFWFPFHRKSPTSRFKAHYQRLYRPGSSALDLLLAAFPEAGDEKQIAAAKRFLKGRRTIYSQRWKAEEGDILNELSTSAILHKRTLEAEMTARNLAAIFPAVARAREDSGIFTPEADMVKRAKAALNDEVTRDILGETWRKKKTPVDPELRRDHEKTVAYNLGLEGIKGLPTPRQEGIEEDSPDDGHLEYIDNPAFGFGLETALVEKEAAFTEQAKLDRILRGLTPKRRRYLSALIAAKGDYGRAAKKLRVNPETLQKAIYLIKKMK